MAGHEPGDRESIFTPRDRPQRRRYRVEQAVVDAVLFRELRIRGAARGAEGIDDLLAALQLVTGELLSQTRREGNAGIGVNIKATYGALITDTAHGVATHYLRTGQPELATQAVHVTLLAVPSMTSHSWITFLDHIPACRAAGDEVGEQQHLRELLAINEAMEEVALPPRSSCEPPCPVDRGSRLFVIICHPNRLHL